MKTTIKNRLFAIILLATIVTGTSLKANAQCRDYKREIRKEKSSEEKNKNNHFKTTKDNQKSSVYCNSQRINNDRQSKIYRMSGNQVKRDYAYKNDDRYRNDWRNDRPIYNRPYYPEYRYPNHQDMYIHPEYGRTYKKFNSSPFVFKHQHGNVYYYNGNFCEYRPGIGYVIIDTPYLTVFNELPFHCNSVRILGNIYYKYDNLYFEVLPHGYKLIPSPVTIQLSAKF